MTTYRTGNAIGSADPRDLYDNAENLDEMVNSQDKVEHPDRLGVPRKTWHGMEHDFQAFLLASGYQDLGDYAAGIEITARNQIIRADGELWRLSASIDLPYTTDGSGMPEDGAFVSVGDAVLRQDLSVSGGSMVGVSTATGMELLNSALNRRVFIAEDVDELRAIPASRLHPYLSAIVATTNRSGVFVWMPGDMSSSVALDAAGGIWVAPLHDSSGASGAWKREYSGPYIAEWTGQDLDNIPSSVSGEVVLVEGDYAGSAEKVNNSGLRFSSVNNSTVNGLPLTKHRFLGDIRKPPQFPWSPPIGVLERNGNYEAVLDIYQYEIASKQPDALTYYIDAANGVDSIERDGFSPETSLKTIGYAFTRANSSGVGNAVFRVSAGIYYRNDSWNGNTFNGNLSVFCEEGTYITTAEPQQDLSWTDEGNGVYSAVRTGVSNNHGAVDISHRREYGKPYIHRVVSSVGQVHDTPGSFFYDTNTNRIYIKRLGSESPGGSLLVLVVQDNGLQADGNNSLFIENAAFIGGNGGAFKTGKGSGATAAFHNCDFSSASNASGLVSESTGLTISKNCNAYGNWLDGFNYHDYLGVSSRALEVNCRAWFNGINKSHSDSENSNASSAHEDIAIVRVNTFGWRNYGPNIVDIDNSFSWNIGCKAWDSIAVSENQKGDFLFTDSSVTAWLDGCEGGTTGYQLKKNSGSRVYIRNWSGGLYGVSPNGFDYY